jgi:Protein of unknown function (DUF1566)
MPWRRVLAVLLLVVFECHDAGVVTAEEGRFTLNGGEATDRKTGLVWQRCCVGRTWRHGTCVGAQRNMTLFDALALQDGTWRVPTRAELESLYQERRTDPRIDTDVFSDAADNALGLYWSSTLLKSCLENGNRPCSEAVGYIGDLRAYSPFGGVPGIHHLPLRMVRTGSAPGPTAQPPAAAAATTIAAGRWILRGGEALDTTTGLTWQRCNAGTTYRSDLGCQGAPRLYSFTEAVQLARDGWRLPTEKELVTLFFHGPVRPGAPLLDPRVFLDITGSNVTYWTAIDYVKGCARCAGPLCDDSCPRSAQGARSSRDVWCVDFNIGWGATNCTKAGMAQAVRLVRADREAP